ncbi:hypothetical protein [Spirosoma aerolatum]|uniref:hypothetical protein n=1 Tax=Spirosoma aerolatum TaxID=1211326 RepID=UPI001FE4AA73|nr:hypothetical protein [Spirosoma aerolatum]
MNLLTLLKQSGTSWLFCGALFHSFMLSLVVSAQPPVYRDIPYTQDYSIKYYTADTTLRLSHTCTDRNGVTQVLSATGLLHPSGGSFNILENW